MSLKHKPLSYGIKKPEVRKVAQGNPLLSEREVKKIIDNILTDVFKLVVPDVVKWINKFVAKRTGQLRKNLILNFTSSRVKNYSLVFILRTSIDYAEKVSKYKTSQVRHSNAKREHHVDYTTKKGKKHRPYAYAYYGGHYGRIRLHDPQAIGNFFKMMVAYTVKSILRHLKTVKRKYAAKTKLKFREMKIIKLW
ncbi:hypothetical protein LCGC14_1811160 [marine sediment metagenome]|uniref:Uncharacterized protein n=1 Tax=marine sediment metagenome TaxID=412755 RepID=A0A0F9GLL3_9ZZZZ